MGDELGHGVTLTSGEVPHPRNELGVGEVTERSEKIVRHVCFYHGHIAGKAQGRPVMTGKHDGCPAQLGRLSREFVPACIFATASLNWEIELNAEACGRWWAGGAAHSIPPQRFNPQAFVTVEEAA